MTLSYKRITKALIRLRGCTFAVRKPLKTGFSPRGLYELHPPPYVLSLTADPGVASSIPSRSHTFVETDYEIISTVIPSAESFKKGCCQLQAKVCARSTG